MTRPSSGNHPAATVHDEISPIVRRQDLMCMKLFGKTLNGEGGVVEIEPTPDSWCGRMATEMDEIKKIATGLQTRFVWGTAAIVGAGAVINVAIMIWEHYDKLIK